MTHMFRRIAHVVVGLIAALSLGLLLTVTIGPRTGRFQVMTVLSGSMGATAPRGSLAIVTPKPRDELAVGDVLTYAIPVEDHQVVTHRVIDVSRKARTTVVRTKGDANTAPDPWVAELHDRTVWTERFAIPHAGRAITLLRTPVAHLVGQLVPILLAAVFLWRLWRREGAAPDAVPA